MLQGADTNWPQFRGPEGDGMTTSKALPLEWSETKNVAWKTPIHGRGWSSPVIWGDQIWLTTATEDGRELSVLCVDRETGKILRDEVLFTVDQPQFAHRFNSHASPTPALEEGRAYVTFGASGTACIDTHSGKVLWERKDLECNHFRGAGSSPILDDRNLYLNFDGSDFQFVIALDKSTGKTVWKTDRGIDFKDLGADGKPEADGDWRKAYGTCQLAEFNGKRQLISQGAKALYGYDPETGRELWRVEERTSHSAGTRPVIGHGLVFVPTGWSTGQVIAVRPGGDVQGSISVLDANAEDEGLAEAEGAENGPSIVWKTRRSVPKKPSLQLVGDLLFGIDDNGIATCWDAKSGAVYWNERIGGNYSASPVATKDRIYFFSEEGKTVVIEASRTFRKLGEGTLDDGFMASPAVTGDAFILRTRSHLYRIETR